MVEQIAHFLVKLNLIRENYRKLAIYCVLALLVYSFSDVLIDLTLTTLHTAFEWFEYGLEELIEHIFGTTRQQTQTIVFYLLLSLGIAVCYRFALWLKTLYRSLRNRALMEWRTMKTRVDHFWWHQSPVDKFKLLFSGSASFVVLAFLVLS
ncbi:MAG: hypothetical protein ACU841_03685 [Gammaproteobacteria bacterium]